MHPLAGLGVNLGFGDVACLHHLLVSAAGRGEEWGEEEPDLVPVKLETMNYNDLPSSQVPFTHFISTRLKDRDIICQSCLLLRVCIDSSPLHPRQWCYSDLWDSS